MAICIKSQLTCREKKEKKSKTKANKAKKTKQKNQTKKKQPTFLFNLFFTIYRSGPLHLLYIYTLYHKWKCFYAFTFNHEPAPGWVIIPLCSCTAPHSLRMHMNASTLNSESYWVMERATVAVLPWGKQTMFSEQCTDWTHPGWIPHVHWKLPSGYDVGHCVSKTWNLYHIFCTHRHLSWVNAILCQGIPYLLL